ncbi:MAG: TetR/AcrR family transcriptional regulator [Methylovulum sp.]|nr:TetR/AcrR family transcriptional regulator [Methylovulum sp.]
MKNTQLTDTQEQILDAAEAVVIERGVRDMTLETVAARAGLSKGGLLYHFPSKDAIVQGMVFRIASILEDSFTSELVNEPIGRGRHARTLLRLMLDNESSLFPRLQRVAAPLLAAMAGNSQLLDPMRQFFQDVRQGMLDDGLSADRSWLVLAALDGIKFWRIFQLHEPNPVDLAKLRILLTQIIDEDIL